MTPQTLKLPIPRRYRFALDAISPIELPTFPGSAWRGLLGHGLRSVACITQKPNCNNCPIIDHCVHGRFFESRDPGIENGRHSTPPHPFVLETELLPPTARTIDKGHQTGFGLTLIGETENILVYLVEAMKRAGRFGIGRSKGKFVPREIEEETNLGSGSWQSRWKRETGHIHTPSLSTSKIPTAPAAVEIEFQTPLRLKHQGRLVGPREFKAELFLRALWRRAHQLAEFHGGTPHTLDLPLPDHHPHQAHAVMKTLRWYDWLRYSSRQKTTMRMGGLLGTWRLEGITLEAWWPLLWYGQWVHLGKATSMGLGRYHLREVPS